MHYLVDNLEKLRNVFLDARELLRTHELNIIIEKCSKTKTQKQLGFIWGMLISDIYNFYIQNGYLLDLSEKKGKDIIKKILYNECSVCDEIICPMTGKAIYQMSTMSEMDIKEIKCFIDKVLIWCDSLDIVLRPESRYTWMLHLSPAEIEEAQGLKLPEKCPEYLAYVRKSYCVIGGEFGCDVHHINYKTTGLSQKAPDWFVLPIAHKHHVRQEGHITTTEILQKTKRVLNDFDIETFCRLCFVRWKYKK